jgi:hypothetical protein
MRKPEDFASRVRRGWLALSDVDLPPYEHAVVVSQLLGWRLYLAALLPIPSTGRSVHWVSISPMSCRLVIDISSYPAMINRQSRIL